MANKKSRQKSPPPPEQPTEAPKKKDASSGAAFGCLLLISLPFAIFGSIMAVVVAHDLWTWQAAQRWVETPATLLKAELDEDADGDGSTFAATARYAYEFNGRRYESDRVALHGGKDNIGSYQRDRAKQLEQIAKADGKTVCFVNPDDPTEAMLFRDLRPGMVGFKLAFALIFGGIGFGMFAAGVLGRGRETRREQLQRTMPDQPWMWRDDWAAGRIRSHDSNGAWFVSLFALIWNGACWPISFMVWNGKREGGGPPTLFIAIFPLVGAGVAAWAIYLWLRRFRWGVSELEMAAVPGVIGGPLAGVIHAPRSITPENGFTLRLVCFKRKQETSGGETRTTEDVLWDSEQTIHRQLSTSDGARTVIPVKFLVPFDMPPSGDDIRWQLEAKAETLGVDYFAAFEAPVFKTKASSQAVKDDDNADGADPASMLDFRTTIARMNAVLEEDLPERRVIRFPMGRNVGMSAFLGTFAVVWMMLSIGLFLIDAPWFFPWVFLAFGLLIVYAALGACVGSTRLAYSSRGVEYAHRWFGLGRVHELTRDRIKRVDVDKSGTTFGSTAYRKVVVDTDDGERTLVKEIASRTDAERLAADIRSVLGLEEPAPAMPLDASLPDDFVKKSPV